MGNRTVRTRLIRVAVVLAAGLVVVLAIRSLEGRVVAERSMDSCLYGAPAVVTASADVYDYLLTAQGRAVDASGVAWVGRGRESRLVGFEGTEPACFSGGERGALIDGGMPEDAMYECTAEHCGGACPTPCYAYHSAAGLGPDVTAVQVIEDLEIRHSGDGISLHSEASRDAIVRRVYVHDVHDDAFESDFGLAGFTIEESLVDRANTAFAMRLRSSADGDQRNEVWTLRENLVRLHEFPNGYRQRPGHGNVFKLDKSPNEPLFRMTDNTIVVGPDTGGSTLFPPVSRVEECHGNKYLFVGTEEAWEDALDSDHIEDGGTNGARLAALNGRFPGCFDVRVRPPTMSEEEFLRSEGWFDAVDRWKAEHVAGSVR